jgi:hypothetical protein
LVDNLYISALRTQSLPFRIQEFIDFKIVDIANETLVESIRQEAMLKEMPPRYLNGIHSEYDGEYLWIWVDFKGKNKEPLDLWFEEGTKRHFIKPVAKKALSWVLRGVRFFSKGHFVSGIEAKHIFENGVQKGYPKFKSKLTQAIQNHLEETQLFGS